jgi:hypothetical protein
MKNKIEDLRNHFFATLEDLRDADKPMEIERAQAIADVAQVIVNSAKVENDHIKLTGSAGSGFIEKIDSLPKPGQPRLVKGMAQA